MKTRQSIRSVSLAYGISPRTLRYYEDIGILESHRRDSRYREYDGSQIKRLETILLLRRLSFPVETIRSVLCGDEAGLKAAIQEKILQSGREVVRMQETGRLLRDFCRELEKTPLAQLDVSTMLRHYSYLTKDMERMMAMISPYKEENRIAMGIRVAMDLVDENKGNLLGEIARLRTELEKKSVAMPKLRVYDSEDLEKDQVLVVLYKEEIFRKAFCDGDYAGSVREIIGALRRHMLAR